MKSLTKLAGIALLAATLTGCASTGPSKNAARVQPYSYVPFSEFDDIDSDGLIDRVTVISTVTDLKPNDWLKVEVLVHGYADNGHIISRTKSQVINWYGEKPTSIELRDLNGDGLKEIVFQTHEKKGKFDSINTFFLHHHVPKIYVDPDNCQYQPSTSRSP